IFGLNFRAVMPVIFVPTPPRYLALPRCVIWLPKVVFFPVNAQTRGIEVSSFSNEFGPRSVGKAAAKSKRAARSFSRRACSPFRKRACLISAERTEDPLASHLKAERAPARSR